MAFIYAPPYEGRSTRDDELQSISRVTTQRSLQLPTPADFSSPTTGPISQTANNESNIASTTPRKQMVFPDPVAFRYLEDDPCVNVVARRMTLKGYELYLVEQWACSRQSPTLVIVTYTGDESHSVVVGVLSIPADESLWSPKLRIYVKATRQYLARPKETELGELQVTNLSSFPSALTVIPVPDGDIRKHRQVFVVNENLKRLGCSGRSGLTLTPPAGGTQAKFISMYRVSEKIPVYSAIMELVKLCQVALYMFVKLDHEYIDGLLCDMTEKAIGNWWTEVGADHYNFEPSDGILGPTTVAALLGMLMGARNRLYWYGAPIGKDVFDIESTKRGIAYFQKTQKLKINRRLDRPTLLKLHAATAKAAAGSEGWGVQKAVKSRMTEIGGKRGEIVMGMVSGKDKGGLADIETLDMERFVMFVHGERAKWLWYGKPRRQATDQETRNPGAVSPGFGKDEDQGNIVSRVQTLQPDEDADSKKKEDLPSGYSDIPSGPPTNVAESPGDKDALRRNVLRSVAGKMSDAKSGFGRIKDAVGGSKKGPITSRPPLYNGREDMNETRSAHVIGNPAILDNDLAISPGSLPRAFTWKNKPEEYFPLMKNGDIGESLPGTASTSREQLPNKTTVDKSHEIASAPADIRKDSVPKSSTKRGSVIAERDSAGPMSKVERKEESRRLGLARRHSLEVAECALKRPFNEDRLPRRMSFGDAEEAILTWEEIVDFEDSMEDLESVKALVEVARHLNENIDELVFKVEPWVEEKLKTVALLDQRFARDKDELQSLYHQLNEACQRVRYHSVELLADERASSSADMKEVEMLVAKLEYEINGLVQRVADAEDGIRNFERQVEEVERRAEEVKEQLEKESWLHWLVRNLTGIGSGPNITRG